MDGRTGPAGQRRIGFRTYADDSLVPDEEGAGAPPSPFEREAGSEEDAAPLEGLDLRRDVEPRRRSRTPALAALGVAACAVAGVGLLVARFDGSTPGEGSSAGGLKVQVEAAPPPPAARVAPVSKPAGPAQGAGVPAAQAQAAPGPAVTPGSASSGAALRGAQAAAASRPAPTVAEPEAVTTAQAESPVRVFVHITDPDQGEAADRVRAWLRDLRFGGEPVATPPVRLVSRGPRWHEVRCLRQADCAAAEVVARRLEEVLGEPVWVEDMSERYGEDPRVRAGTLEAWLRL